MEPQNWFVLYTCPRREKKTFCALSRLGFDVFFPTQLTIRQWSDRRKAIEVPLFPNYVFFNARRLDLKIALSIPGVIKYLSEEGVPAVVPSSEICMIRKIAEHAVEVLPSNIVKGDRVQITSGHLAGTEGVLQWVAGRRKVAIQIKAISKVVVLQADQFIMKKIEPTVSVFAIA